MISQAETVTPELVAEAEKKASIYLLLDPETKRVRYVGKANDPAKRLAGHIRDARTRNRPVCNWVAKLVAKGLEPVMKVLFHDVDDWKRYETQTIKTLREQGYDLLNLAKGGDDIPQSKENRAASSKRISSYNNRAEDGSWATRHKSSGSFEADKRSALARHYHWSISMWSKQGRLDIVADRREKLREMYGATV